MNNNKLDPSYNTRPIDSDFVDVKKTPLNEEEICFYLKFGFKSIFKKDPSINVLSLFWAQVVLETGRNQNSMMRCYNFGNIKKNIKYSKLWTSYEAGECLNGKYFLFQKYHPQTFFSAWDTPLEGAEAYIRFLSQRTRYRKAWVELMAGDPVAYCRELKAAGYFTADLGHYTRGVVRLTEEFKRKSDDLVAWEPPEPEPEPIPPEPDPVPKPELEPSLGFFAQLLNMLQKLLRL